MRTLDEKGSTTNGRQTEVCRRLEKPAAKRRQSQSLFSPLINKKISETSFFIKFLKFHYFFRFARIYFCAVFYYLFGLTN